jgi:hypothetical protein
MSVIKSRSDKRYGCNLWGGSRSLIQVDGCQREKRKRSSCRAQRDINDVDVCTDRTWESGQLTAEPHHVPDDWASAAAVFASNGQDIALVTSGEPMFLVGTPPRQLTDWMPETHRRDDKIHRADRKGGSTGRFQKPEGANVSLPTSLSASSTWVGTNTAHLTARTPKAGN